MIRSIIILLFVLALHPRAAAQGEIQWTVNINTDQITQTDPRVFKTLEKDLSIFLNGQVWTQDRFEDEERLDATIFLTLMEIERETASGAEVVPEQFKGNLALQVVRPVYGTGEVTPTLNYQDERLQFSYAQFDAIQFSEQTYTTQLASLMAYYSYIILGLDYDTFAPMGGQPYYEAAQEIYNRLPQNVANSSGWTAAGRSQNRYALLENLLNPRMIPARRALYNYHRLGLDLMVIDPVSARKNITLAIEDLKIANQDIPNSALVQAIVDAKREEIINIYAGAPGAEQNAVISMMSQIDPSKSGQYRQIRNGANRRPVGRR